MRAFLMLSQIALSRVAVVVVLVSVALGGAAAEPSKTVSLKSQRVPGAVDRVEVTLEVAGDLLPSQEWKVEKLKMSASGTVHYEERSLELPAGGKGALRSIRFYDRAEVAIKVGSDESKPRLRDQRRLIGVEVDAAKTPRPILFSPQGTLTSDELEMVDLTVNSLVADWLLPDKPVSVGESWKNSDQAMAAMWNLERVSENDVKSTLISVQDEMARMELGGTVTGIEHSLPTTIELKAKYRFDMKVGRITWLGIAYRQTLKGGGVHPGLDAMARLQLTVEPVPQSERLSDEAIKGLALAPSDDLLRMACEAANGSWQLAHSRLWEITTMKADAVTLRMSGERGEAMAQCKVSMLPQVAKPEQHTSLADFQADVQRGLEKSSGQLIESSETENQTGYHVLRVAVRGKAKDVIIRWVYYLVADRKTGRRAVFVFDLQEDQVERFGHADLQLVNSFRFADRR